MASLWVNMMTSQASCALAAGLSVASSSRNSSAHTVSKPPRTTTGEKFTCTS